MIPPISDKTIASIKNWLKMWRGLAPTALRKPISRVRSATETNIIFIIPMPPTKSEIAAIPERPVCKIPKT
ncbi:MAG: hypothetical protein ACD_83C00197G0001 [uncultured bacterium]|nr:MAG: hypothetical protein ACD_83C00197G0001 [uncultured bacterium]